MSSIRKKHSSIFKAKVALEAIKGDYTISEISSRHGVHSSVIARWKKEALSGMSSIFQDNSNTKKQSIADETKDLYQKIGELTVERDFLVTASKKLT